MRKILGLLLFCFPLILSGQDNIFDIIFKHDFENNNPGAYDNASWNSDWFNPGWRDSEHNNGDQVEIINDAQTGSKVMEFEYPKGAVSPSGGTTSDGVWTPGGGDYWNSYWGSSEKELYFSYNVKFKPGFQWNEGGKLPGINGGPMYEGATHPSEDQGFSCILMFHPGEVITGDTRVPDGRIKFYLYHQDNKVERYADSRIWDDHGDPHVFNTAEERWYNITIRVVLNTFSPDSEGKIRANYDGIVEGFIDGQLKESWTGLRLLHENNSDRGIEGMIMASFFGGSASWQGALRDEWAYFDDFYLFKYDESQNVPRGNNPSPAGRTLRLPNMGKNDGVVIDDGSGDNSGGDPVEDKEAPSIPDGVKANDITTNSVELTWNESTDNVAVLGYDIHMNGKKYTNVKTNSIVISGLKASTEYRFEVLSYDHSWNLSGKSQTLTVKTKDVPDVTDTAPPSQVSGLKADNIGYYSVDLSWHAASDNVAVAGYTIYANGIRKATVKSTSHTLDKLNPGVLYNITITAFDKAGNESIASSALKLTTKKLETSENSSGDAELAGISFVEVNNSEYGTETVTEIKSIKTGEIKSLGVRFSKDENFSSGVEVISAERKTCKSYYDSRINRNLQLLYNFTEGSGNTIIDRSCAINPLNLSINQPSGVEWMPGQGMTVSGDNIISSENLPTRFLDSLQQTNEISIEAWIKTGESEQDGPARIFSFSEDHFNRAFTLGQSGTADGYDFIVRLNTSNTDPNGTPEGNSNKAYPSPELKHIVYTRNADGIEKMYVDGEQVYYGYRDGDFSSWSNANRLVLGNELIGERAWNGSYFLVAAYNTALDESEILHNYAVGFGKIRFKTQYKNLEPNTSYYMQPFVMTEKGTNYGEVANIITPDVTDADDNQIFNSRVYPNPSKGDFTLYFENDSFDARFATIRVMDITGKIIYHKEIALSDIFFGREERISLDPSRLNNGFYIVALTMGEVTESHKLMIYK